MRIPFKIFTILYGLSAAVLGIDDAIFIFFNENTPEPVFREFRDFLVLVPMLLALFASSSIAFNVTTFKRLDLAADLDKKILDDEITLDEGISKKSPGWKVVAWGGNTVFSALTLVFAALLILRIVSDWLDNDQASTPILAYIIGPISAGLGVLMLIDSIRWRQSYSRGHHS